MLYHNLPTLDLHGEPRDIAVILVKEFIEDYYQLKKSPIIVVHGIGKSILKEAVHQELKKNHLVKKYQLDLFNIGQTIIDLNL